MGAASAQGSMSLVTSCTLPLVLPTKDPVGGYFRFRVALAPGLVRRCGYSRLVVEAAVPRSNKRKDSAKIRNRRMQRKFNGSPTKPRLSVFCSAKQLYAMLIDDQNKKTLFYGSTLQKSIRGDDPCSTAEAARRVGEELVNACVEMNICEISSYDRNGFARGERMEAFEIAIADHGFLPR